MKNEIRLEEMIGGVKFVMFNDVLLGTIYQEVDGFYVFNPSKDRGGYWTENYLLGIADVLTRMNKPWNDYINEAFNNEEKRVYTIYDYLGIELPLKNGNYRTLKEATDLVERLNIKGENAPYTYKIANHEPSV